MLLRPPPSFSSLLLAPPPPASICSRTYLTCTLQRSFLLPLSLGPLSILLYSSWPLLQDKKLPRPVHKNLAKYWEGYYIDRGVTVVLDREPCRNPCYTGLQHRQSIVNIQTLPRSPPPSLLLLYSSSHLAAFILAKGQPLRIGHCRLNANHPALR